MKYRIMLWIFVFVVFVPVVAAADQGQVSLTLNPGFTLFAKNSTYNFNNGPAVDIGFGFDTSDETNASVVVGYSRFSNALDSRLSMNLMHAGVALKQYLNNGISKGYLTGGLNVDVADFSGVPEPSSGVTKPAGDAGLGFNVGAGIDLMATSTFFFGPVIKYEGIILQKTYLSLITFQLSLGFLF